jgi:ABC-2 type transport system ATP-binding protein
MTVIRIQALTKRYGTRTGVESVNLEVEAGAIFGFLGPNGAGKTTTIRVLLGFLRATSGQASILGRDCWRDTKSIKRDVGYLPGDLRLYPWLDGERALDIVGAVHGRDLHSAGAELAERFDLDLQVRVRTMSRGMRQKLGIILALAHGPRVLVFDEPTSGLDPLMQDELADLLRERAAAGVTVFFSSHTLSRVEELCDRVGIIRKGRLVADESLDTLRRRARRRVMIEFENEAAAQARVPAGLGECRRDGVRWEAQLAGAASTLVAWAAEQRVADLTIEAPDLDAIFRSYYRDPSSVERTAREPV